MGIVTFEIGIDTALVQVFAARLAGGEFLLPLLLEPLRNGRRVRDDGVSLRWGVPRVGGRGSHSSQQGGDSIEKIWPEFWLEKQHGITF